jgi:hypothetical protein
MAYESTNMNAPKLDGQALKRYVSKNIKENIFQKTLALPEKGVTEQFSTDTSASEIRIIRQVAPDIKARQLGGAINGGYFNSNSAILPQSVEYGLKILYMIDDSVDFPTVMDEMVEVAVADATTKNVGGIVARNINASTIAHQIASVVNASIDGKGYNAIVMDSATSYKDALLDANSLLDNGDTDNGIDIFPVDGRQGFLRNTARTGLLKSGNVIIGGSNYAQEMLARGVISPDTYKQEHLEYFGEIDGVPMCVVGKPVWDLAEQYLVDSTTDTKLTAGKLDNVEALVCAGISTGRALAFNNEVKIIDCPRGQGKTAQYKYRWGVEVFTPKGIVPVLKNGTALKDISANKLNVVAPASHS